MDSKVKRFKVLFGNDGSKVKGIVPHFFLMSPYEPKGLNKNWAKWMAFSSKPNWIKLEIPDRFYKITRCNFDGKPNQNGKYCIIGETKK